MKVTLMSSGRRKAATITTKEMEEKRLEEFFSKKQVPNIKPRSATVMDNSSHHPVNLRSLPSTRTRKQDIQHSLSNNTNAWNPTMLKGELLNCVDNTKVESPGLQTYRIDVIAE